ncbi:MAG TPA: hypothetical protein VFE42_29275 [Chloroflexota bacterium]|nr:hypothetical protein [Chloroflexota bacterium]
MTLRLYLASAAVSAAFLTLSSLPAQAQAPGRHLSLSYSAQSAADKPAAGRPATARSFMIQALFTTTKKAFDAWYKSTSDAPPRATSKFPSGTSEIGYYFAYARAVPKVTKIRVNIYADDGSLVVQGILHTLHHWTGSLGNYFYDQPSFPDGTYRMTVMYNNKPLRSTTFKIGK